MNYSRLKKWPLPVFTLILAASTPSFAQPGTNSSTLTVEQTAGPVKVRQSERWRSPADGMIMAMPSIASTGIDGRIKVRQEATVISVAASTAVEFLDSNVPGEPIQRVIQERGSAFYDIAPRGDNKLRVEAAYLAAVVKGTQFHVMVEEDSTTISLYEGELQIEAPGVGDVVDLFAGQIARMHRGDRRISVISMENGELVAREDDFGRSSPVAGGAGLLAVGADTALPQPGATPGRTDSVGGVSDIVGIGTTELSGSLAASLDAGIGEVSVSAALSADLGSGEVGLAVEAGADLGGAEVDLGADAGADLGAAEVDLGADAGADVGAAEVDLGVDASADLGAGEADLGADLGALEADASLDLGTPDEVGESLTDDIGDILDDSTSEPDPADAGSVDPVPDLRDLTGL